MADSRQIDGQVVDANGAGVPGAIVAVEWGTAPTPEIGIRADAAGRFQIALPPGEFRIMARAADQRQGSCECAVPAAERTQPRSILIRVADQ